MTPSPTRDDDRHPGFTEVKHTALLVKPTNTVGIFKTPVMVPFSLAYIFALLCEIFRARGHGTALWAVNCGGPFHEDVNGVEYMADPLDAGVASDYGTRFTPFHRVPEEDFILYQTERYDTRDFSYEFPRPSDGAYVLTLKFSEVWFDRPGGKVFDVAINKHIKVISDLDIFARVGFITAHDEYIPFSINNNILQIGDASMDITGQNSITVNFLKGSQDNPKVNAIILYKGTIEDVPKLPPLQQQEPEPPQPDTFTTPTPSRRPRSLPLNAPPAPDPYGSMDSSYVIPVIVCLAAFLPVIFCLCKL
ncbi:unnamed protein product [Dibothriocephalus latus]|uniref:Malectin domain-containing protein n=1 Tax=Dibothriocephalus latus TaxID=60516 RepID=A0A3P7NKB9_DIBLA|nr:unnamed protein product [Dibothriocephalus latus]